MQQFRERFRRAPVSQSAEPAQSTEPWAGEDARVLLESLRRPHNGYLESKMPTSAEILQQAGALTLLDKVAATLNIPDDFDGESGFKAVRTGTFRDQSGVQWAYHELNWGWKEVEVVDNEDGLKKTLWQAKSVRVRAADSGKRGIDVSHEGKKVSLGAAIAQNYQGYGDKWKEHIATLGKSDDLTNLEDTLNFAVTIAS